MRNIFRLVYRGYINFVWQGTVTILPKKGEFRRTYVKSDSENEELAGPLLPGDNLSNTTKLGARHRNPELTAST